MGNSVLPATTASLDLTHVVYDPSSNFSLLLALFTLSPVLLNASYAALIVQTRELTIALMWAGQLACEVFNYVVKKIVKQPRPFPDLIDGYGFPSSHSQWMGYFSSFLICHLFFHHRFSSSGVPLLDLLLRGAVYAGLLAWSGAVVYSRYHLNYHTVVQVGAGYLLGVLFGVIYFVLVELIPTKCPASLPGRFRTWLVGNPISTWLRVRDGWVVWGDGGFEDGWQLWRKEWEHRRAAADKKRE